MQNINVKTVVARFSEVKSLYTKGELTGEDEEGEAIDVNKVSTALRSAGINMNEYFTGAKGLDEIFLELAEKWDSLDIVQQRYIATMAAGSRQQSRFIAMMSNYERTIELVDAANNSTGASTEQFNKTLESMESKLAKLKNAWQEFTMGLANNEILKGAVDLLTLALNTINKLINALSGGNGLVKSVLSLITVIGGLSVGSSLIQGPGTKLLSGIGAAWRGETNNKENNLTNSEQASTESKYFDLGQKAAQAFQRGYDAIKGKNSVLGSEGKEIDAEHAETAKSIEANETTLSNKRKEIAQAEEEQQSIEEQIKSKNIEFNKLSSTAVSEEDLYAQGILNRTEVSNLKENLSAAQEKVANLKTEEKALIDQQENLNASNKRCALSANEFAAAGAALGMLLTRLASKIKESYGEENKAAEILQSVGTALMTLPIVLRVVGAAFKVFGADVTATFLSIPIVGWIAAIITAIIALVSLIAKLHKTQAELAQEARDNLEKAQEQVEELNDTIDDLTSKKEEIQELVDSFDDLTVGTQEWQKALVQANAQILELANQYPQLQKYIEVQNGLLVISEEGWDAVIEATEKDLEMASTWQYYNQNEVLRYEIEESDKEAKQGFAASAGNTSGEQDFIDAVEQAGLSFQQPQDQEKIEEMYDKAYSADRENFNFATYEAFLKELLNNDAIDLYGLESENRETQNKLESNRLIQLQKLIQSNSSVTNSDDYNLIEDTISREYADYDTRLNDELDKIKEEDKDEGNDEDSLYYEYGKLVGLTKAEVAEKITSNELTKEEIQQKIAANRVDTEIKNRSLELTSKLNKIESDAVKNLLSTDGSALTEAQINEIKESSAFTSEESANIYLNRYGTSLEDLGLSFEEFRHNVLSAFSTFSNLDENVLKDLDKDRGSHINNLSSEIEDELTNYGVEISASLASGISDTLSQISLNQGNVDQISSMFSQILADVDTDNIEEATELIYDSANWTDATTIRSTLSALEDLGAELSGEFKDSIVSAAGAVEDYTTQTNKVSTLSELRDTVEENDGRVFDKETYESLIENDIAEASDFAWTGPEEWTYLGEDTNDLLRNIDATTTNILEALTVSTEEAVAKGQAAVDLGKEVYQSTTYQELMDQIIDGSISAESMSNLAGDPLEYIATRLGIDTAGYNETDVYNLVKNYLTEWYGEGGIVLAENKANLEERYSEAQLTYSGMIQNGKTDEVYRLASAGDEDALTALKGAAIQNGTDDIEKTKQNIAEYNEELANNEALVYALVAANATWNKKQDKLNEVIGDTSDILKSAGKQSAEYSNAIDQVHSAAKDVFGEDITKEFVEENDYLFAQLAEEGETAQSAYEELCWKYAQNLIDSLTAVGEELEGKSKEINDVITSNIPSNIEIGAEFDATSIIQGLIDLELEAEEAQKILEALGYDVQLEYTTEKHWFDKNGIDYGLTEPSWTKSLGSRAGLHQEDVVSGISTATATKRSAAGTGASSSSASSSSGDSTSPQENDLDELINLTEKLAEAERKRNLLEEEYDLLLKSENATSTQIYDNLVAQRKELDKQYQYQKQLQAGRLSQIQNAGNHLYVDDEGATHSYASAGVTQYITYNETTNELEYDWQGFENLSKTDPDTYQVLTDYQSYLEDLVSQYEDIDSELLSIEESVQSLEEQARDSVIDFENQVKEAVLQKYQDQIDELTSINDSISDANSKILDGIQQQIDLERQIRDNTDTEKDLSEKEARLAYLQRDTSGANALEIKQLQEELDQGYQDYQDTLIDQELQRLNDANQEAIDQRQQQIQLLTDLKTQNESTGLVWNEVKELMNEGLGENGLVKGTELEALLLNKNSWDSLSTIQQEKLGEELQQAALSYLAGQEYLQGEFSNVNSALVQIGDALGTKINQVQSSATGTSGNSGNGGGSTSTPASSTSEVGTAQDAWDATLRATETKDYRIEKIAKKLATNYLNGATSGQDYDQRVALYKKQLENGNYSDESLANASKDSNLSTTSMKWPVDYMKKFKTGGLADFTGPAWLDGTKSRPEIILNQSDSQNFIQLKEILSDLLKGNVSVGSSSKNGDMYLDININVDEIANDYDVEQMVRKVKESITQDASYRNFNSINFLR